MADPHLKLPRTYEWNVTVEQSLGRSQVFSLTYVGAIGRDLLRVSDLINVNNNFNVIALTGNKATSDYHALQVKFERPLSRGLQARGSYTWSHSIDSASTDAFDDNANSPGSSVNPNTDRGNSNFDVRHSFTAGVTYSLPFPQSNRVASAALGGWSVDGLLFARSAPPVDLVATQFLLGVGLLLRPNVNPGSAACALWGPISRRQGVQSCCIYPSACRATGGFRPRCTAGFGAWQADVAFQRQFSVTEKVGLRFRGEFFNIFNHPSFGPPDNNLADALFGQSTQTLASSLGSGGANGGLNPLYQIGAPRSIQLALKLQF